MSSTVLYMSMSLDGFVTGPNDGPTNGLGDGGEQLHEWIFQGTGDHPRDAVGGLGGVNRQVVDEFMTTGAVIAGRGTFEPAEGWGGDHHDGVPVFIFSRNPAPAWAAAWPTVRYTNDLDAAVREAKHAAGDKNVLVHGAGTIVRHALAAGLLDEIQIHLVPILLNDGRRLFEGGIDQRRLERIQVLEGEDGVTHIRYRVRR
ncbi:dihydrofolate reductase family protein [Hamadaea tsunoensis]|uniref:dihydrofolate reductase family protein n=1 Tax=Hamadaea tsunoensis TaxID=53368 RepID=UPI000400BAA4|nr:dihydrofolate reductase family protein [Hamadaea tsunoensis]